MNTIQSAEKFFHEKHGKDTPFLSTPAILQFAKDYADKQFEDFKSIKDKYFSFNIEQRRDRSSTY